MLAAGIMAAPWLLHVDASSDDGLLAAEAMLLAGGRVPYRDYFSVVPPLPELLYGAVFRVFGASYLTYRLPTLCFLLASGVLLLAIARRVLPVTWAFAACLVWLAWMSMFFFFGPYHFMRVAFTLSTLWALLRARQSDRAATRWAAAAGACAAAATASLPSMAVVGLAALVAAGILLGRASAMAAFAGGGLVVGGTIQAYLVGTGSLGGFWSDVIVFAASRYIPADVVGIPWTPRDLYALPVWPRPFFWPGVKVAYWLVVIAAPIAVLIGLAWCAVSDRARRRLDPRVASIALVSSALFAVALFRSTGPLLWFAAPLTLVLVAGAIRLGLERLRGGVRRLAQVAAASVLVAGLLPGSVGWLSHFDIGSHPAWAAVRASGTTVYLDVPDGDLATVSAALDFVRSHSSDKIAFVPYVQHLYLITGRPPPISYVVLVPGYEDDAQLVEVERQLTRGRVRWVLYRPLPPGFLRQNLSGLSAQASQEWQFDAFLNEAYSLERSAGPFRVYELRINAARR